MYFLVSWIALIPCKKIKVGLLFIFCLQDALLCRVVQSFNGKNWKKIGTLFLAYFVELMLLLFLIKLQSISLCQLAFFPRGY